MKTLLLSFLISILFLISCISQKRRAKICATCPTHTVIKDSIRIEIKDRDVPFIVRDSIPYWLPNPCAHLCDSNGNLIKTFKETIVSNKGAHIELSVKNNELVLNEIIDSLKGHIKVQDTLVSHYKNTTIEVPTNCKLEHLGWWDKFFKGLGQILSILILLFFGFKVVKYYLKFHLP